MTGKDNTTIYHKLLKSKIFFLFLTSVFFALTVVVFQKFYYRYMTQKELDKISVRLNNLKEEKNELNGLINYYKDESNLEKEARVRLNLKKESEKVVIILPQATSTPQLRGETISGVSADTLDLPNYKQWWYYFFK